jgi:hypothetical protein
MKKLKWRQRWALTRYLADEEAARLEALPAEQLGPDPMLKECEVQVQVDAYVAGLHVLPDEALLAVNRKLVRLSLRGRWTQLPKAGVYVVLRVPADAEEDEVRWACDRVAWHDAALDQLFNGLEADAVEAADAGAEADATLIWGPDDELYALAATGAPGPADDLDDEEVDEEFQRDLSGLDDA